MKKISLLVLLVCLVFSLLTVVSFAEVSTVTPEAETAATEEKTATWSETIAAWFADNMESIFSGASLGGVAVLMFLFKKGLIPTVGAAVTKISGAVDSAKEKLGEVADGTSAEMKAFANKFAPILERLEGYTDVIDAAMAEVATAKTEKEILIASLEETNKLLLSMIEASRLPESVKEKARLAKAKQDACIEALRGDKEGGGEAE